MSEPPRCGRCDRVVPTTWPHGDPLVSLRLERVFHQEREDGTCSTEPAGYLTRTVCLVCGDVLWNRAREILDGQGQPQ